ncbi:DUF4215 domain-containing protein [Myxococcota bacterium]
MIRVQSMSFLPSILWVGCLSSMACGQTGTSGEKVTGVRLIVRYDAALDMDQLAVSILLSNGETAFGPHALPDPPRALVSGEESMLIYLPDELADTVVFLRVDGLSQGAVVASALESVELDLQELVAAPMTLADAATCGDGRIGPHVEQCDDGNAFSGDGCSTMCWVESGWLCSGSPSTCSPTCDSPSTCNATCGDGVLEAEEACDDANLVDGDGCSQYCAVELGYTCPVVGTTCSPTCGDAFIRGDEQCDDANLVDGDGCSQYCAVELGYTCPVAGTACSPTCGDGVLRGDEQCDDHGLANADGCSSNCDVEWGWSCTGEPSVCHGCQDGVASVGEMCDGTDLKGETCLSRGYRRGEGPGLACRATCDGFVVTECSGGPLDSLTQISGALADAHGMNGHAVISIHAGIYLVDEPLVLDECGGECTDGRPFGVTLRPVDGDNVIFRDAVDRGALFQVRTGNNMLTGFVFQDVDYAIELLAGVDAGDNVIHHILFENVAVPPRTAIKVSSKHNTIEANRFANLSGSQGERAAEVKIEGNTIAMNVIFGPFKETLKLKGTGDVDITFVDHNSLWVVGQPASTAVLIEDLSGLCYRNNIIYGDGQSIGIELKRSIELADSADCGGRMTKNNINGNHDVECLDDLLGQCDTFCASAGPMCDLDHDPEFSDEGLCLPPGSPLIDAGLDVGYDTWDSSPLGFNGEMPDLGARESGAARAYGGEVSFCPLTL